MILEFCQWLYATQLGTAVRESGWPYPIILSSHLLGIGLIGGLLLVSNMRLLGVILKDIPVSQVVGRLLIWKRLGAIWTITFGILLFSAKPIEYYHNPVFWTKMMLLVLAGVHALVFRNSVYQRIAEFDKLPEVPPIARRAALLSTILWVLIPCGGRLIAYYEVPRDETTTLRIEQPENAAAVNPTGGILAATAGKVSTPSH